MTFPQYATRASFKPATMAVILLIHVLALAAPFTFTWAGLIAFVAMVYLTGGVGISAGYHRLLTHNSFKAPRWVKYVLTFFACLSLQGGPIFWVSTHRLHHKESDKPLDPHTPTEGFLWSHMVWNFFNHPLLATRQDRYDLAPDLAEDAGMRFFDHSFFLLYLAFAGVLYAVGHHFGGTQLGLSLVVWGCLLRTVWVWHVTWLVNSATHTWGYQNYNAKDQSRNSWWVALLTFGEGWHNNHHAEQRSANFGHRWFEVDITYWLLRGMSLVGMASGIIEPRHKRVPLRQTELAKAS